MRKGDFAERMICRMLPSIPPKSWDTQFARSNDIPCVQYKHFLGEWGERGTAGPRTSFSCRKPLIIRSPRRAIGSAFGNGFQLKRSSLFLLSSIHVNEPATRPSFGRRFVAIAMSAFILNNLTRRVEVTLRCPAPSRKKWKGKRRKTRLEDKQIAAGDI